MSEQGCLERVLQTGTRCPLEDMLQIADKSPTPDGGGDPCGDQHGCDNCDLYGDS